ncbi:hypothetical protein CL628_02615 [bacterium]|nr:hypothetical protein [bacterium]
MARYRRGGGKRDPVALGNQLKSRLQVKGNTAEELFRKLGTYCKWASLADVETALKELGRTGSATTSGFSETKYHKIKPEKRVVEIPAAVLLRALHRTEKRSAAAVRKLLPADYDDAGVARVGVLLNLLREGGKHGVRSSSKSISRTYWKETA